MPSRRHRSANRSLILRDRGVGILLQCVFLLPETFEPTLLKVRLFLTGLSPSLTLLAEQMKADQVRRATGDRRHMSALEKKRQTRPFRADFAEAMKRPFLMFVYEPIVMFISLYMSVVCKLHHRF